MKKLALCSLSALALLAAGCGSDTKSCTSRPADLAATPVPSGCSVAAGSVVSIPVRLCPQCSDSSPSCQADFDAQNRIVDLNPTFQECEEDLGCPLDPGCGIQNSVVDCRVSVPANAAGRYDIIDAATARPIGTLQVGGAGGCAFAVVAGPQSLP